MVELPVLIAKLPDCWKGILGALSSRSQPQRVAQCWLQQQQYSHYGRPVFWDQLLTYLCNDEPSLVNDKLVFIPCLRCFASYLQRELLSFILQHGAQFSDESRRTFLQTVKPHYASVQDSLCHRLLCQIDELRDPLCAEYTIKCPELFEDVCSGIRMESEILGISHNVEHINTAAKRQKIEAAELPSYQLSAMDSNYSPIVINDSQDTMDPVQSDTQTTTMSLALSQSDTQTTSTSSTGHAPWVIPARKLLEFWHTTNQVDDLSQIKFLAQSNESQMLDICRMYATCSFSVTALQNSCKQIVALGETLTLTNLMCFVRHVFQTQILQLDGAIPRAYLNILMHFTAHYPDVAVKLVLLPCLQVATLDQLRCNSLLLVIKECLNADSMEVLLSEFLKTELTWTEGHLHFTQSCVAMKVALSEDAVDNLLKCLLKNSSNFKSNLKMGKLMSALLTKYSKQFTAVDRVRWSKILEQHSTFMKKSCENLLKKLIE